MKKMVTVMMMFVMLFSFSITASAAKSPEGKPTTEENGAVSSAGQSTVSPKTGESDIVLYSLGLTAVVCASGAVVLRRKTA